MIILLIVSCQTTIIHLKLIDFLVLIFEVRSRFGFRVEVSFELRAVKVIGLPEARG